MRNNINTKHFQNLLESEKVRLEKELSEIGERNEKIVGDWQVSAPQMDILQSDRNEVADKVEEIEERALILEQLESEYNEVAAALGRIKADTYGLCGDCGEDVPLKRLEAYPAASTCLQHAAK